MVLQASTRAHNIMGVNEYLINPKYAFYLPAKVRLGLFVICWSSFILKAKVVPI